MGLALGIKGDVAHHLVAANFDNVDGAEVGPFLRQHGRQSGELAGLIGYLDAHRHAIIAIRLFVHGTLLARKENASCIFFCIPFAYFAPWREVLLGIIPCSPSAISSTANTPMPSRARRSTSSIRRPAL